jgi:tRNA(fMet)-specific endonuclease VapC
MRYLLDTNTCILAMRGIMSVVGAMAVRSPDDITLSSITAYELFTGVEKCANPVRERNRVEELLSMVGQIVFDWPAALSAARIRAELELRGEMIGPYDVLIAGHAVSLGLTLVTSNTHEFSRVRGLAIEDWQLAHQ